MKSTKPITKAERKIRERRIRDAEQRIHQFHKLGQKSLRKYGSARDHSDEIDKEAKDIGENPNTMRKARRFADEAEGYNSEDLKALIKLYRNNRENFIEKKTTFGRTHIIRLLSVDKAKGMRAAMQEKAIKNCWGVRMLEEKIVRQCGWRRHGGRRPRVPQDKKDLLAQLKNKCEKWCRWYQTIAPTEKGPAKALIDKLPANVRKLVKEVSDGMEQLNQMVFEALDSNPSPAK